MTSLIRHRMKWGPSHQGHFHVSLGIYVEKFRYETMKKLIGVFMMQAEKIVVYSFWQIWAAAQLTKWQVPLVMLWRDRIYSCVFIGNWCFRKSKWVINCEWRHTLWNGVIFFILFCWGIMGESYECEWKVGRALVGMSIIVVFVIFVCHWHKSKRASNRKGCPALHFFIVGSHAVWRKTEPPTVRNKESSKVSISLSAAPTSAI